MLVLSCLFVRIVLRKYANSFTYFNYKSRFEKHVRRKGAGLIK